ncbi:phage virion morphogenesis protein [Chitinimonas koreensis]|uniref:phage virion morphogenesis protein n=1 Tax=Chitinimonas koreensis TaxID=356302 RepID=UPI00048FC6C1|nr:phage virion morphogenesis protein [Chitinimonas koreensis]QNM96388.1 phage virion morphogenesis protein [Chitinimonas koreensis]
MDDLTALADWCDQLLARLSAGERRQLAREIARDLLPANARRIAAQQAPDGTPYTPRKAGAARDQRGHIRRGAMFAKLRTTRWLRAEATAERATVGFAGRVGRIALVHHEGLRDRVRPGGPEAIYPARPLLGLAAADVERIRDTVLAHLAGR